jgi:beta-phosphoglucomutase
MKIDNFRGALFDLDGVLVDTAKYHYLAWHRLANELGFEFSEIHNERLKGVSRMRSLEILLEVGHLTVNESDKMAMATKKNNWYLEYISEMDESELLPGAKEYLQQLKNKGVKIGLGSASKNALMILNNLNTISLFDAIIDGNKVAKAKPDPEVFLLGAQELGLAPQDCVVFEDAIAGIEAAQRAGMKTVGIGNKDVLTEADYVVDGLWVLAKS